MNTIPKILIPVSLVLLLALVWSLSVRASAADPADPSQEALAHAAERWPQAQVAVFAGGCFWCMEEPFRRLPGVLQVASGYTGGNAETATYGQVTAGGSGHVEAVQVYFDPRYLNYREVLEVYWRQIDPTDKGGQFADRGAHYRPVIFVANAEQRSWAEASRDALATSGRFSRPLAVTIEPAQPFYLAEDHHQRYSERNPGHYQRYARGSGRKGFLENTWAASEGEQSPLLQRWAKWEKPDAQALRQQLSAEAYRVTQQDGTERPFNNAYWDHQAAGIYVDVVSGEPLFASTHRFDSGTGWPSFSQALEPRLVLERNDTSHGMTRIELRSRHADSHLGHLFMDGPKPSGLRYCINSAALRFVAAAELEASGFAEYAHLFAR